MYKTSYQKGIEAEEMAVKFLQKNKFLIRQTRLKTKEGEIDILAQRQNKPLDYYIFEVKTRKDMEAARESVGMHQINRSINAFYIYAQENNIEFEQIYLMAILISGKSLQIVDIDSLD